MYVYIHTRTLREDCQYNAEYKHICIRDYNLNVCLVSVGFLPVRFRKILDDSFRVVVCMILPPFMALNIFIHLSKTLLLFIYRKVLVVVKGL